MKKPKKGYDSTTPEPFKPEKTNNGPAEDPDKTKRKEKNDHTWDPDPDIKSNPEKNSSADEDKDPEGSYWNRTEV